MNFAVPRNTHIRSYEAWPYGSYIHMLTLWPPDHLSLAVDERLVDLHEVPQFDIHPNHCMGLCQFRSKIHHDRYPDTVPPTIAPDYFG